MAARRNDRVPPQATLTCYETYIFSNIVSLREESEAKTVREIFEEIFCKYSVLPAPVELNCFVNECIVALSF